MALYPAAGALRPDGALAWRRLPMRLFPGRARLPAMALTRRDFLYRTAPLAALPFLTPACGSSDDEGPAPPSGPFRHGVASGDPLTDRVVIWTRVTPEADTPETVNVEWQVAEDPELTAVVAEGTASTDDAVDHTVKVDVDGLEPGRTYYYQFSALGESSPLGRTKTLPEGSVARARFAVASCANYPYGFFNAYAMIARRPDLDAVLHLGDYLYEYGAGDFGDGAGGRVPDPKTEVVSLTDYRRRHAQYKTDPDLQEAHRQHPFIAVWDDHETANDAWRGGAQNHEPESEGDWETRKNAALQAYFEWMPIRDPAANASGQIYRSFRFGTLIDLVLLDTRLAGRDAPSTEPCDPAALLDPNRQLLGEEQEQWFVSELVDSQASGTTWRVVGQQVMFAQLVNTLSTEMCVFNPDQWDGYAANRARILQALSEHEIDNVVILTGDLHSSWANEVTADPFDANAYDPASGTGSQAVELITPAVTSPGIEDGEQAQNLAALVAETHPHVKYVDLNRRGYLVLDVTPEQAQAEWYHVDTITKRSHSESLAAAFFTRSGENHLRPAPSPTAPIASAPPLAPAARQT